MPYYEDLSTIATEGGDGAVDAVAVGWLDAEHEMPVGETSPSVLRAVEDALHRPVGQTRGFHRCPFCEDAPFGPLRYRCHDGSEVWLGTASIELHGRAGRSWRAPTMIAHYIAAHGYRPPDQFVQDVEESQGG